jgi:hypothetical protein
MHKAEEMALQNYNNNTICELLGWDREWLHGREDILTRLRIKRAEHRAAIRGSQFNHVKNPIMAMFLGKNVLGQADKQEISGKDGAPLVPPVIQVLPVSRPQIPLCGRVEPDGSSQPAITGQKEGVNDAQAGD